MDGTKKMKKIEEDIIYSAKIAHSLGLFGKRFLVTGATGMIGQNLVVVLSKITNEKNIVVLGKDLQEPKEVFLNRSFVYSSFDDLDKIVGDVDYIIHLASPTNSKFMAEQPVETIDFIYNSTKTILDFALKHKSKVLYVSSMEVFGEVLDEKKRNEEELGYISLTSTRSSYSESKRLCELLCLSYSKEYKLKVCSARLAQTFGAGTPLNDSRIFGYISRCVKNKEDIILKTKGKKINKG